MRVKDLRPIAARLPRPRAVTSAAVDEAQVARIFQALGEPARLRIMQVLPPDPACRQMYNVAELAKEVGLGQPTVSHHLKVLRAAGLVLSRRECSSLLFYVNRPVLQGWLKQICERFACTPDGNEA